MVDYPQIDYMSADPSRSDPRSAWIGASDLDDGYCPDGSIGSADLWTESVDGWSGSRDGSMDLATATEDDVTDEPSKADESDEPTSQAPAADTKDAGKKTSSSMDAVSEMSRPDVVDLRRSLTKANDNSQFAERKICLVYSLGYLPLFFKYNFRMEGRGLS